MMTEQQMAAMQAYFAPVLMGEPCAMTLRQVPLPFLEVVWPHVAPWISERVVERSNGEFSIEGIAEKLITGAWQLWVVFDGEYRAVLATEITKEGIARIHFATGKGADRWKHLIDDIKAWAKNQGCHRLHMLARKGWARHLPEFKVTHVLLETDLTDGQ